MELIILDRDGVINQDSDDYIKSADEFIPIPGSLEAISRLNHAGYLVVIATNQSGISRGYFSMDTLNQIHDKLKRLLNGLGGRVDGIFFCPHGPDEDIDLEGVPVVGDSLRDLQAAQQVGAAPILVRTGKGERTLAKGVGLDNVPVFDDLASYVDYLLEGQF
ncbi:MAG: HAD family hydrolase [Gammaproteobacteria bacterium]